VVVGAGGLAMAIARRIGATYRLLLSDLDTAHLDRQVADLRLEGHDVTGIACDVSDPSAVDRLAKQARADGPVRVLVHVVGLSPSMADARTILRVNLIGPTLVADAFLELAQQGTAAVFIASLAGHSGGVSPATAALLEDPYGADWVERVESTIEGGLTPGTAYSVSKFGVIRLCRRRVGDWGGRGARILSLSPGLINSPQGAAGYANHPEKYQLVASTPLGREGTMIEIADAVEFLVSDRASFISGIDLLVDGGLAAATGREHA
jgi:NAD(P)-dependent dehydrogenase (short-subunit alcohol dehydrogenase family)